MYKKLLPLVFLFFSTGIVFTQAQGIELRVGSSLSAKEDSLFIDLYIKRESNYQAFQLGNVNLPLTLNLGPLKIESDRNKHIKQKGPWSDLSPAYEPMEFVLQSQSFNLLVQRDAGFAGSGVEVPDSYTLIARLGFEILNNNCNELANITWGTTSVTNYQGNVVINNPIRSYEEQVNGFKYSHPFPKPIVEATPGLNDILFKWEVNSFASKYEIKINNDDFIDLGKTGSYRKSGLQPGESVSVVVRATKAGAPDYRCGYSLLSDVITTTTNSCPRAPTWRILADTTTFEFCIAEPNRELVPLNAGGTFAGNGVFQDDVTGRWYFKASDAGLGTHQISYTLCNSTSSKSFTITPTPCVTTVIGPIESIPGSILVRQPKGINTDCDGTIFLSDLENHVIYKVDVLGNITLLAGKQPIKNSDGSISSYAGDNSGEVPASSSLLRNPVGVVVAPNGDVYFADAGNHKVKRIRGGLVRTVIGNGVAGDAEGAGEASRLNNPQGLALSPDGRYLYITDRGNFKVKRFDVQTNTVVTFAGNGNTSTNVTDGFALQVSFSNLLAGITANENHVFVSDNATNAIRRIDVNKVNPDDFSQNRVVVINNRLPGFENGPFEDHRLSNVLDVSVDAFGNLFFADAGNNSVRLIDPNRFMSTIAGNGTRGNKDGPANVATFNEPAALSMYVKGFIDVADNSTKGGLIRRVAITNFREGMFNGLNPGYAYCVGGAPSVLNPQFGGGDYTISPNTAGMLYKNDQQKWVFDPKQAGTFTLTYIYTAGACSETFTQQVVVNPLPESSLLPQQFICERSTLTLDAGANGVRYEWSGPNVPANSTGRTLTVNQAGTYRVVIFSATCSAEYITEVVSQPSPTAQIVTTGSLEICNGQSVTLTASGGSKYTWYHNGDEQADLADQPEIVVNKAGVWKVVVQANLNACTDEASVTIVNVNPVASLTPSGPLQKCIGQTVSLSASGGDTYKWFFNNVEQTQLANQTTIEVSQEGEWKVVVGENGVTCTDEAIAQITDVAIPTASPQVENKNVSVCEAGTLQLTVKEPQTGLNYRWVMPDGTSYAGTTLTITNVTALQAGTYQVFARRGLCEYNVPETVEVTVKPLPQSTLQDVVLCERSTVVLNAGNDGTSYKWTLPNGSSITTSAGTLTVSTIGSYSVEITKEGCTKTFTANVSSAPRVPVSLKRGNGSDLPSVVELCPGGSLEVVASGGSSASQYTWLKNGVVYPAWSGSTNNSITEAGRWSVVLTAGAYGCADTASVELKFFTPPASPVVNDPGVVCAGSTLTLSAADLPGISYRWVGPNGFTSDQRTITIQNVSAQHGGTYRVTAISASGCISENATEVPVTITPLPVASITGLASEYCVSGGTINLSGQPENGTFRIVRPDGVVINSNSFTPSMVGTYTVTYTVSNNQSCSASVTRSVVVTPVVTPQLSGLAPEYCSNAANVTVQASPAGGRFTLLRNNVEIESVSGSSYTLKISTLETGLYELVYRIEGDGCSGVTRQFVRIAPVITPTITLDNIYCPSNTPLTLTAEPVGGTFKVNGVVSTTGTLDISQTGSYLIEYSFGTEGSQCSGIAYKTINVGQLLADVVITNLASQYCVNAERVQLQASPAGGTFTVNGVPVTYFDPQALGEGLHLVVYTLPESNCLAGSTVSKQVQVSPVITPTISNLSPSYCLADAAFTLQAAPAGGTFFINGVAGSVFAPSQLGAGTHTVEYKLNGENCQGTVSAQVTISSQPEARILNLASSYCNTSEPIVLEGDPRGGYFTIGSEGVTVFNPAYYAGSTVEVNYILDRPGQCEARTSKSVTVGTEQTVSLDGIRTLYCLNETAVTLSAQPQGGSFMLRRGSETIALANNVLNPGAIGEGTYQLVYQLNGTCSGSGEVTIRIQEQLVPEFRNLEDTYCTSAPAVQLQGVPAGGKFELIRNGATTELVGGLFEPSRLAAGTYTVRYIYSNGNCQGTNTKQVSIVAPHKPVISSATNQVCINSSFDLNVTGTGEFRWFRNDSLVYTGSENRFSQLLNSTGTYTYKVVLRNNQTCVDSSVAYTITVNPLPVAGISPVGDQQICEGSSFELTATGGASYQWLRDGSVIPGATAATYAANRAGVYTVTAISEFGCRSTTEDSVRIIVNPLPTTLVQDSYTVCSGESLLLQATDDDNIVSYEWTYSSDITWKSTEASVTITQPGSYQLVMKNSFNCTFTKVFAVRYIESVSVNFTPAETECNNVNLPLRATVRGEEYTLFWSTKGAGTFTTQTQENTVYTATKDDVGPIEFSLRVANECSSFDTTFVVVFRDAPNASFITSAVNNEVFLLNNSIRFTHEHPRQGDTYAWNFGDGSAVSTEPSPTHSFTNGGDYEVKLVVTGENGCKDSTSVTIKVLTNKVVYVPNIFSPNHPQPENQTLRVFATNVINDDFVFIVYNRWGQVVYETRSFQAANTMGWNGVNETGAHQQQTGVYTYVVKGKFVDGSTFEKTGTSTLIK